MHSSELSEFVDYHRIQHILHWYWQPNSQQPRKDTQNRKTNPKTNKLALVMKKNTQKHTKS